MIQHISVVLFIKEKDTNKKIERENEKARERERSFWNSWAPELTQSRVTVDRFEKRCCRQAAETKKKKVRKRDIEKRCWSITLSYPCAGPWILGMCLGRFSVAYYDRCVLIPIQTAFLKR